MKTKKILSVLLAIITLVTLLAACAGTPVQNSSAAPSSLQQSSTPASTEITITDMAGRNITLPAPAQRVVVVDAADCEILYAIGAGGTLVGRGTYCDYPEEALDISVIESGEGLNTEQIIALNPDVVIMAIMAQTEEQVQALQRANIPVVATAAADIGGVYEAINIIGTVCGKQSQAEELTANMQQTFADVQAKAEGKAGGSVYFEVSPLQYGLWAAGGGTFMQELATMLGLTNIFEELEGWVEVSAEQVLQRDPDYIVTTGMYFGEGPTPAEEIYSREGWQNINALKNNNVYNADSNAITRPGPRLALAAQELYNFVYGEE